MPKLPAISAREAVKAFQKIGYVVDHQTGAHVIMRHTDPPYRRLTIPNHAVIAKGTLRSLMRESGITLEELLSLL